MNTTTNLFVITGAPGSGKTPIIQELVALGFKGVDEAARRVLAEQRAIGGEGVSEKNSRLFCDLMLSRAITDVERMSGAETPPEVLIPTSLYRKADAVKDGLAP